MTDCCKPVPAPQVININDLLSVPASVELQGPRKVPGKLFDEESCSVLPEDFKPMFGNLQDRLEELFRQVLDQQKELHYQLSYMCTTNVDTQATLRQQREELIVELRDLFSKSPRSHMADNKIQRQHSPEDLVARMCNPSKVRVSKPTPLETVEASEVIDPKQDDASLTEKATSHEAVEMQALPKKMGRCLSTMQEDVSPGKKGRTLTKSLSFRQDQQLGDLYHVSHCARLSRLLECKEFELGVAMAILINAFIMCWECQYQGLEVGFNLKYRGRYVQAHETWPGADTAFTIFDWFFGCLFLLEMIVKLVCWREKYFWVWYNGPAQHWMFPCKNCLLGLQGWNLLDAFCVVAFLFSKIASVGAVNPQVLRSLRLVRLGRLVRLLRFLETLDHLYIMTTAIAGLTEVLSWAIVLLTIMLVTCDLFLVQILHAAYFDGVKAIDLDEAQMQKYHEMYAYFGTCTRCMLSMFEITLGNWPPIARLLSEEVSEWFTLLCLLHKVTIGFAVIGVITGVILQETFKVAQTDDLIMFRQKNTAKRILRNKFQSLFEELDESGDGKLDLSEVKAIADYPEIKTWLGSLGIETGDLKTLFELIDINGDGAITIDELVSRMPRIQGFSRSIDVLALQRQLWKARGGRSRHRTHTEGMEASFADYMLEDEEEQNDG